MLVVRQVHVPPRPSLNPRIIGLLMEPITVRYQRVQMDLTSGNATDRLHVAAIN